MGLATTVVVVDFAIKPIEHPRSASANYRRGFFVAGFARLREAVPKGLNSDEPSYDSTRYFCFV